MTTFKVGDTVRCTDASGTPFVRGHTYTVTDVSLWDDIRVSGHDGYWHWSRFAPYVSADAVAENQPSLPGIPAAPDGNPKTRFGMAKPPLALIPGPALVHMAEAFRDGAGKYGPANWREDPVTTSTYVNAALRHILSYYDGETNADDSGVHHLAHALGCLAIILDAEEQGTLNDDRPTAGRTAALIKEKTRPMA